MSHHDYQQAMHVLDSYKQRLSQMEAYEKFNIRQHRSKIYKLLSKGDAVTKLLSRQPSTMELLPPSSSVEVQQPLQDDNFRFFDLKKTRASQRDLFQNAIKLASPSRRQAELFPIMN